MDIRPNTAGSPGTEAAFGSQNASPSTSGALGERTISTLTANPLTSPAAGVAASVSDLASQLLIKEAGGALASLNGNGDGSVGLEFFAAHEFTMTPPNEDALAALFGNSTQNSAQNQGSLAALFGEAIATHEGSLTQLTANMDLTGFEVFSVSAETVSSDQVSELEKVPIFDVLARQTLSLPEIQNIFTSGISKTEILLAVKNEPENFEVWTEQNGTVTSKEVKDLTAEELLALMKKGPVFGFKPTGQFIGGATAIQNRGSHFLAHANAQREKKGLPPLEPENAYVIVSDEIINKFLQGWAKDLEKQAELQKEDRKKTNKKTPELEKTKETERILKKHVISSRTDTDTILPRTQDLGVEIDPRKSQNIIEKDTENFRAAKAKELKKAKAAQAKDDEVFRRGLEQENLKNDTRKYQEKRSEENT